MLTAEKIVETFQKTTGEISLDEAVEQLIILERLEQALADQNPRSGQPHAEFMTEIRQWIHQQK
jgi:hypothetical protein